MGARLFFSISARMTACVVSLDGSQVGMESTQYFMNKCELMRTVSVNVLSSFSSQSLCGCESVEWKRERERWAILLAAKMWRMATQSQDKTMTMRHSCHKIISIFFFYFAAHLQSEDLRNGTHLRMVECVSHELLRRTDYHENVIRRDQKPIKSTNYYYFH